MNVIKCDLRRSIQSKEFILAVLIMTIVGYIALTESLAFLEAHSIRGQDISMLTLYSVFKSNEMFLMSIPIACALIYGTASYDELNYRFIIFSLPRSSRSKYIQAKMSALIVSSFSAVLLTWLLMIGCGLVICFNKNMPVYFGDGNGMESGIQIFSWIVQDCLGGVLWALTSAVASIVMNSKYMAYITPFLLYYILDTFQKRYYIAYYYFNPAEWMSSNHMNLGICMIFLIVFCVVLAGILEWMMRKKIRDV
ncbi:hypothetical protein [Muricomes intestini]|jgi:hypothetical protein|uniref:ABC-2 family transporter n=4 Tax=Muricomes intestini TaxID=1796634 RepID=A0A4R3K5E1_9FIRM|nr:hypothetical protein EDD59_11483 [Muricomes intestini]HAX51505.1 hypothetical protein [Lachnospiraceae bacterium]HCR84514.1 hypothetical protein [Lachnospiraceae bacterium]